MRAWRFLSHLLVCLVVFSLLISSAGPIVRAQEGGPVCLPFIGSGRTTAPASDLLRGFINAP